MGKVVGTEKLHIEFADFRGSLSLPKRCYPNFLKMTKSCFLMICGLG